MQFPKNFLKRAFEKVRAYGGVCIADEVRLEALGTDESK